MNKTKKAIYAAFSTAVCVLSINYYRSLSPSGLSNIEHQIMPEGYVDLNFTKVRRGMGEAELVGLLGPPLLKTQIAEDLIYFYTIHKDNELPYYQRLVIFTGGYVRDWTVGKSKPPAPLR